jgi:hypothetical protein
MTVRLVHIEFTSPKKLFKPFAWLIKWFERTDYSHVRIRWVSPVGEELIYEASGSGVKLIGAKAQPLFPVHVVHSYGFELTKEQYRELLRLFRYSSVQYGILQIFGIAVARCLGLKKNPFSSGRYEQVCSELVAIFLQEVLGWKLEEELDLVGPRGIKELLDSRLYK